MSTPTSTLPLKTDRTSPDQSDINDPIVQDVLNEFREELMTSKNKEDNKKGQQNKIEMQEQQQYQQQQQKQQQYNQQQYNQPQYNQPQYNQPQYNQQSQNDANNQNKNVVAEKNDNFPYTYIDFDVIKKSLVIVILAILIYHTGIINNLYEKVPEYLQENLNVFDIYIKSVSLFVILYTLILLQYI